MKILYNSKQKEFKQPFGCLRQDELCTLTIQISRKCNVSQAYICVESDDKSFIQQYPMEWIALEDGMDSYQGSFSLSECNLYFYYFHIVSPNSVFNVFKDGYSDTRIGHGDRWQITCYHKDYDTPSEFKGKVMYQIFPDRFYAVGRCDTKDKLQPFSIHNDIYDVPVFFPDHNGIIQNNDFFGGNLQGIIAKLPYLKDLNVSVIYLNPIFMAYSNHRYDTADYKRVDPLLGTEEDFKQLCDKAHEMGMKVILDVVFSHTGSNSIYFDKYDIFHNGAYHNPDSPYRSWYQFHQDDPTKYDSWWGIDTLPCVDELNPSYLDYIITGKDSVVRHWMELGADGYRLDVADELPDEFIRLLNQEVKNVNQDSLVIGEVWEDASNKVSYDVRRKYFSQRELDSVMNYPYKNGIIGFVKGDISSEQLADTVMTIAENYPKPILDCVMNSLSTHDTMRVLTVLGVTDYNLSRDDKARYLLDEYRLKDTIQKLKVASFLQFTLPGTACIYYGDEVGCQGFEDPFNRRYFPWDYMNLELLDFYKELTSLKVNYPALQTGSIRVLSKQNGVFTFIRQTETQKLYVIVSLKDDYECFTDYKPVMIHNGRKNEEQLYLNKYGFVLLEG